jgi:two-component system nitrate/nitrite response regulator NarL
MGDSAGGPSSGGRPAEVEGEETLGSKTAEPIRVLIADDQPVYRDGLAEAIKQSPALELVGQAESGSRALEQIRRLRPEVAVLDTSLPGLDGIEVARALARDELPSVVLFLSDCLESDTIYRAVAAGARGYLSKHSAASTICDAVSAVADGQLVLAPETQEPIAEQIRLQATPEPSPLSERELEVLSHIADGHSVAEIASRLYLSPFTVKTHVKRAYRKLGVSGRGAAVAEAMRRGLFQIALIAAAWSDAPPELPLS